MSLPHIPPRTKLSPLVTRLLAFNPTLYTLQGTNTYLVGNYAYKKCILVDAGQGMDDYTRLLRKELLGDPV